MIIKPLEVLGKRLVDVSTQFANMEIKELHDNLEEAEEQEFFVSAPDESWEFHLGKDNTITTIFLFLTKGFGEFDGVNQFTTRDEILKKYGSPTKYSQEKTIPILGKVGAWERYDYENYVLHFSHCVNSDKIDKISFMLPNPAP